MKYLSFLGAVCALSLNSVITYASSDSDQKDKTFVSMGRKPFKEAEVQGNKVSKAQKRGKQRRNRSLDKEKENIPPQQSSSHQAEACSTSSSVGEAMPVLETSLSQRVHEIHLQVQEGFKEASPDKIYQAFNAFENLKGVGKWTTLGRKLGLRKSPSQESWKETVGAHIFRPANIITWEDHYSDKYKLRRKDTLWALAIGARFNDPLSKDYLAKVLWKIQMDCVEDENRFPDIIWELFDEASADLKQEQEDPLLYHVLRKSTQTPFYHKVDMDKKKIFDFVKKGDLRSQFEVLEESSWNKRDYSTRPTVEDYYELGEKGFYPAYIEAAKLVKEFDKKIDILKRALEKGYRPALLNLGCRYDDIENDEEARSFFKRAGDEGIIEGYVELGNTYVGDEDFLEDLEKVKTLTKEDIQQGIKYFTLAGEAHHPEGWEYLIKLKRAQARLALHTKGADEAAPFMEEMFEAVKRGMALGSLESYGAGEQCFSKRGFKSTWERLIQLHGPSFEREAFCKKIEAFIRKKGSL